MTLAPICTHTHAHFCFQVQEVLQSVRLHNLQDAEAAAQQLCAIVDGLRTDDDVDVYEVMKRA